MMAALLGDELKHGECDCVSARSLHPAAGLRLQVLGSLSDVADVAV